MSQTKKEFLEALTEATSGGPGHAVFATTQDRDGNIREWKEHEALSAAFGWIYDAYFSEPHDSWSDGITRTTTADGRPRFPREIHQKAIRVVRKSGDFHHLKDLCHALRVKWDNLPHGRSIIPGR